MERREFLMAAAATAGLTVVPAALARGSEANGKLALGLIGCGGRGVWLGRHFEQHGDTKIVAVHDYFRDKAEAAAKEFGVAANRVFVGLDGYKELLQTPVDAIAVETPPCFHPDQAMAGIEAGKHVYMAKPVAVDVWGCNRIVEAGKKAGDKLCLLVDFQTRNNEFYRGAAERVHAGMIGTPVCGQTFYYTGRLGLHGQAGPGVARLRNWVFDQALSGDIIVEQNIHVLDVMNWYLQGHPEKASGDGGRKARTDVGDCWDHFIVKYTYPKGVLVDFSSTQFVYGFDDLCTRLFGDLGTVESHYGGDVWISGKKDSWKGGKTATIYQEGAINNIKDFRAAIAAGKPINNAAEAANSTLTSVLGRMASYQRREVTWDEMMKTEERLDLRLDLPADGPDTKA